MGLMDAISGGLEAVGGTAAKIGMAQLQSAIEEERLARLVELQSEIRMRDEQTRFDRKVARAPEENRMAAEAATSRAESELSFKEGAQGRTQAMAASDSAAKLIIDENEQPRRSWLINVGKSDSLKWEQENAGTVNKLAKDKARATHIDDGAGLRAIQIKTAQLALDEKEAEVKMPYAAKQAAAGKREQIKSTEAAIDKAIAEQSPGLDALQSKQAKQQGELSAMYKPYLPEGMKSEKPTTDRPPLESFGTKKPGAPEKKVAPGLIGGTDGGHYTQPDTGNEKGIRAAIEEKSARAALKGIDPQIAMKLRQEIAELQSRLPNSGRRLNPLPGM